MKLTKGDIKMKMNKAYAGVGARHAPPEVLKELNHLAKYYANEGYTLRSGSADGCDSAFERGCSFVGGKMEIFLPWRGFNGNLSPLFTPPPLAYRIAEKYHPAWNNLSPAVKKLMARNSQQILGKDCNQPCEFVLCYTKGGKLVGGTSQALRIAIDLNIPVINLGE